MGAKRIQVSADGGTTYRTLPGSSGEWHEELATVTDTVFGQDFESNDVSLGQWNVTANGYFKGVAGYIASLKQQGTPTTMTAEPMSLVSGNIYQVTAPTKQLLDMFSTLTATDAGGDVTAKIESIDYLNGTITFDSAVTAPVTVTGKYIPLITIAKGNGFTLNMTAGEKDVSNYDDAQANGGWRTFEYGLKSVSLDVNGIYAATNGAAAALRARAPVLVDIHPDNTDDTFFRGYFKRQNRGQSGDVGAVEAETQTFGLWVPDGALVVRPFGWYFTAGTVLNPAIQDVIAAWQGSNLLSVRYQDDPDVAGSGHVGDAIVTQCNLTNAIDGLNEFSFGFRGTGDPTDV